MITNQFAKGDYVTLPQATKQIHARYLRDVDGKVSKIAVTTDEDYEKAPTLLVVTDKLLRGWIKDGKTIKV